MAIRYTAEHLLFLKESPLCTKPEKLPPAEEWMGAPPEQIRAQNKSIGDRPRSLDNPLLDQTNRRPGINHLSRNNTNPEDIVFAPPRMAFASSGRGTKTIENDKTFKDADSPGRFNMRSRNGETDADRLREPRGNPLRRRGDSDLDNDGWSTVKPRKSFGAEGAERFHGRMGGNFRDEKKPLRETDRDATRDRPTRPFDTFPRERDGGDNDGRPRNGLNRSKLDSWHRTEGNDAPAPEKKERDRTKSWRDRDTTTDALDDRGNGRMVDRRWGRDREQRIEREPEWFDEPAEANRESHTQQDFQKWMEQMKKAKGNGTTPERPAAVASEPVVEAEKPTVQPTPAVEAAPDKFFLAFGAKSTLDATSPSVEQNEAAAKPKNVGKSSRFTSFFNQPHEEARPRPEQLIGVPPNGQYISPGPPPGLAHPPPPEEERQAFQQLLAKLQKQSLSATPPAPSAFAAPPPINPADAQKAPSPESFPYGERRDIPMGRPPPQHVQEILAPRPQQQSARPEQLLLDLVGHHQRASSGGAGRPDQARNNSNTEFLMNLMRAGPDVQRQDILRMAQSQPQPQKQTQMPPLNDREPDFSPRDNRGPQRQMRPQPPPGFPSLEEAFHNAERDPRPTQPTQILQRPPPPPGLEQMPPSWMTSGGQMPPPQQRGPMMPPPGLPNLNRNMPMPHMFPPNFPPGGMPPPDAMAGGMPPRNMPPPPPGFFNGPPHGFMPPGLGGFNGPPGLPDSHAFGGSPFEARGMPPTGNGRGAAFGRP